MTVSTATTEESRSVVLAGFEELWLQRKPELAEKWFTPDLTFQTTIQPEPFRPVLRGLLVTGEAPTFLRVELAGGAGDTSAAADEALWWPPGKIVGRYLAPFLAERAETILSPAGGVGS